MLCTIRCSHCAFRAAIMPGWPFSVCWAFLLPPEKLPVSKIFLEIFKKAGRIGCFRCHISGKGKIHPTSPRKGGEKMEAIPRNDGEQYRFDAFCKAVLRNEARNYHRNKKRLLDREKSFSVLSLEELGQLTSVDHIARFTLSEVLSVRHFRWQSMMIGYTKIHLNFSLPQSL